MIKHSSSPSYEKQESRFLISSFILIVLFLCDVYLVVEDAKPRFHPTTEIGVAVSPCGDLTTKTSLKDSLHTCRLASYLFLELLTFGLKLLPILLRSSSKVLPVVIGKARLINKPLSRLGSTETSAWFDKDGQRRIRTRGQDLLR